MIQHLTIKIYGKVQNVGFRFAAHEKAGKLGLAGFARNEPDGSLYIEVEGDDARLKEFLAWCGKGTRPANVERIESEINREIKGFAGFS